MAAGKVKMTQEDKAYFKNGVKTLCGTELITAIVFMLPYLLLIFSALLKNPFS